MVRKHAPRFTIITTDSFKKKIQVKAIRKGLDVTKVINSLLVKWLKEG